MESSYKLNLSDISSSHIGSFDAFIDIYSKRIVEYLLPVYIAPNYNQKIHELNTGTAPPDYIKIFIKNIKIGHPKRGDCTDDADERLYPVQSRLSHTTYSAPLYVTFALQPTSNGIECNHVVYKEVIAGQIPIMVKSKRCNLHGLSEDKLVSKGEDAQDPGGYFIVRGNERIVRHIISSRSNYPIGVKRKQFKTKDALNTEYAIIMRSQRQDGTVVGNILCYTEDERCMLRVNMNKGIKTIPFGTLLKAAKPHMSTCELKKRLVEDFLHNEEMTVHFYNIFQNMVFIEPLIADVDFIENRYLHQLGKACWHRVHMLMKPGSTLAECGLFVMKNYICVQSESLDDKFECLLHMFKKLILLARGYIIPDQIDSLAFQEVTLPGQIYSTIIKESLFVALTKLRSLYSIEIINFKKHLSLLDSVEDDRILLEFCSNSSLFNYLTDKVAPEIPNKINYFLSTGNINSSFFEFQQNLGWTIIADRMNYFRFMSHFRSVHRGNAFTQMLSTSMRKLLGESWGFLCPVHTPDGTPCGLLTHLSQYAKPLTTAPDPNNIISIRKFLKDMGYAIDLNSSGMTTDYRYLHRPAPVVVDGIPIARIPSDEVPRLMDALIAAKLTGSKGIKNDFEIFNTCKAKGQMECIHIYTFPGRMVRIVKNLKFNRNELIGPISQQWSFIAVNEMELKQHNNVLRGGKCIGSDSNKLLENTPVHYTHIEIEPHGILSLSANCTPFSEFNQSPRNMYECQMLKQSMGMPVHSQCMRSDGKLYTLITPQSPLVSTSDYRRLNLNNYAAGANAVVAIMAYTGFDMEDAMVINKSSIERGFLRASICKTKVIDAAPPGCSAKDSHLYVFKGISNSPLDRDGLVRVGDLVVDGSPLARIEYSGTGNSRPRIELYRDDEAARVSSVTLVTPNPSKNDICAESIPCNRALIRLHSIRIPDVGDKFASRHGQKGILSMTWRHEDMPFTESGLVPDILFNPHGFPSRMTIGMLIEALAGKSAAVLGDNEIDGTTFASGNDPVDYFGSVLRKAGFRYYGTEDMYSGTTGTFIKTSIFMGCIYYQRLRHMVADKAQVRSTGPIDSLTHQPVQGKKRHGGIRFGEMERDSLISYGAPFLLQDRLLNCSDLHLGCICPKCGSLLTALIRDGSRNDTKLPLCTLCNIPCHWVRVPYVLRYLANELASINIGLKFKLSEFGRPLKMHDESLSK